MKVLVLVLVLVLDHEVLVLVLNIWSWSWSRSSLEEKVLQFSRLLLQFLMAVSKAHHGILWETAKAVCHLEAIVWEKLLRSMHISLSWEGCYLLGNTDASKAQHSVDCGKLLSLGSNKPGKQTVHGLKCHLQKCHKDTLYTRKVESRQGPPAKKAKLDEVLAAHCRADLVTERMKYTNIIRWLSFSFTENECLFSFRFRP